MRWATRGCEAINSSVRPQGLTVSQRIAPTARSASMPCPKATAMASAARGSKMPIARIDRIRLLERCRSAASALPVLPDATRAAASTCSSALTCPMP